MLSHLRFLLSISGSLLVFSICLSIEVPSLDISDFFDGEKPLKGATILYRRGIYHENTGKNLSVRAIGNQIKPSHKPFSFGFWIDSEKCFRLSDRNNWVFPEKTAGGVRSLPELCRSNEDHVGNQARISNWTFSTLKSPTVEFENKYEAVMLGTDEFNSHLQNVRTVSGPHLTKNLLSKRSDDESLIRWFSDNIEFLDRNFAVSFSSGATASRLMNAKVEIEQRNGFVIMVQIRDVICIQKDYEEDKWSVGVVIKSPFDKNVYLLGERNVTGDANIKPILQNAFNLRHSLLGQNSPIREVMHTIIFREDRHVFNIRVSSDRLKQENSSDPVKDDILFNNIAEIIDKGSLLQQGSHEQLTEIYLEESEMRETILGSLRKKAIRNQRISDKATWSIAITTGILAGCAILASPSVLLRIGFFLVLFEFSSGSFVLIFAILEGADIGGLHMSPLIRNRRFHYGNVLKGYDDQIKARCGRLDTTLAMGGVDLVDSRLLWVSLFFPVLLFLFGAFLFKLFKGYKKYQMIMKGPDGIDRLPKK